MRHPPGPLHLLMRVPTQTHKYIEEGRGEGDRHKYTELEIDILSYSSSD